MPPITQLLDLEFFDPVRMLAATNAAPPGVKARKQPGHSPAANVSSLISSYKA
jgi:hypothetical protein